MFSMVRDNGQRCIGFPCKCLATFVCCACCQDGLHIYGGAVPDNKGEEGNPNNIPVNNFIASVIQPNFGGFCHPQVDLRKDQDDNSKPFGKVVGEFAQKPVNKEWLDGSIQCWVAGWFFSIYIFVDLYYIYFFDIKALASLEDVLNFAVTSNSLLPSMTALAVLEIWPRLLKFVPREWVSLCLCAISTHKLL